jgi:hypothetical protein
LFVVPRDSCGDFSLAKLALLIGLAHKGFSALGSISPSLEGNEGRDRARIEEIFDSFSKAWLKYWESYVELQNQLYESLRAAREVSWLAATDPAKLSEINRLQRELFAGMPRRLDYMPLGQVSQDIDSAPSKIAQLDATLASEEDACRRLVEAIAILKAQTKAMREALNTSRR